MTKLTETIVNGIIALDIKLVKSLWKVDLTGFKRKVIEIKAFRIGDYNPQGLFRFFNYMKKYQLEKKKIDLTEDFWKQVKPKVIDRREGADTLYPLFEKYLDNFEMPDGVGFSGIHIDKRELGSASIQTLDIISNVRRYDYRVRYIVNNKFRTDSSTDTFGSIFWVTVGYIKMSPDEMKEASNKSGTKIPVPDDDEYFPVDQ